MNGVKIPANCKKSAHLKQKSGLYVQYEFSAFSLRFAVQNRLL